LGKDLYFEPLSYLKFDKPRRKVINFYEKDKSNFQKVSYEQYEKQLRAFTTKEKKSIDRQLAVEKEYSFSGGDFKFS
jgi:hypothetical protein